MSRLRFRKNIFVLSLLPTALFACGGSVGAGEVSPGTTSGGSSFAAIGGAAAAGSGFITGTGSSGIIGGIGGTASTLPSKCLTTFDPGYACSSNPPALYTQYDPSLGRCIPVQYNGCGGATSGTFATLGQCQALCEQRPSDSSCPVQYSPGMGCTLEGAICSYGVSQCLCTYLGAYTCLVTDPRCDHLGLNSASNSNAPCTTEVCTIRQDIVIASEYTCTCTGGTWQCSMFYGY